MVNPSFPSRLTGRVPMLPLPVTKATNYRTLRNFAGIASFNGWLIEFFEFIFVTCFALRIDPEAENQSDIDRK